MLQVIRNLDNSACIQQQQQLLLNNHSLCD